MRFGIEKQMGQSYNTIHVWMLRHHPKSGICEMCGEKRKTQWSNKDMKYTRNIEDWQELCASCHKLYDYRVFGIPLNHGRPKKLAQKT